MVRGFICVSLASIVLAACAPRPTAAPTASAPATAIPATPTAAPTAAAAVTPTPDASAESDTCTDAAAFVADVTVPDYSHFDYKQAFTKVWRVKNVGTCTWTADYKAMYSDGDALGAPASIALSETAPGATLDISAIMNSGTRDGKFEIFYKLTNAAGSAMPIDAGSSLWALITVGKYVAYPPATAIPASTPSSGSGSAGPGLTTASCVTQPNATFISQMLTAINAARAAKSLPALTVNDKLNTAAQSHSQDMACNNFVSHTGWNGSTPDSRIASAGYSASITRENIYAQPPQYGGDGQAAVDWWMGDTTDPSHSEAILNAQTTEIGLGYAYYSRSTLGGYFTVDFAAP